MNMLLFFCVWYLYKRMHLLLNIVIQVLVICVLTSEAMSTYVLKEYSPPSWAKQLSYVPTHRYQASSEELNGHHYNSEFCFVL